MSAIEPGGVTDVGGGIINPVPPDLGTPVAAPAEAPEINRKNFSFLPWVNNEAAKAATSVTGPGGNAGYSLSNLQTIYVPETYRTSNGATVSINFDFGAARDFNVVALVGHNLTDLATVTALAGSVPTPSGSEFTKTIQYRSRDMYVLVETVTFRYVTIVISDPTNSDAFIELAAVLVGLMTEVPLQFEQNWTFGRVFLNRDQRTNYGTPLSENLSDQISMQCVFTGYNETDMDTVYAVLIELCKASVLPLFIIPRPRFYDGFFGTLSYHEPPKLGPYAELECAFLESPLGEVVGA